MTQLIRIVVGAALLFLLSATAFGQTAPVVSDIPDQTIAEGSTFATISLDDFVADAESADSLISWSTSGESELSVSIDANRIATITIPTADWFGAETITFTATDPDTQTGADGATFTVTAVNDPPVVSDIPDQTVAEGATFTTIDLSTHVTDVDGSVTWGFSGNTELGVSIVADVATITIPDVDWFGAESITFTATDTGLLADSDPALFTVTAVNDAPIVSDIPDQTIAEGSTFTTVDLSTYVTDVDGSVTWGFSGNTELGVSIVSDVATITIPDVDWFGAESITFTATDTGLLADSDPALFTVTAVNDAPVVSDIPDQTIAEGATFTTVDLSTYVTDVDGSVTWGFSGNTELGVSIVSDVATITIPDVDWFGAESITFTATDTGLLADSDPALFTVTAVNDAPVVSDIPDQTIAEGATFTTVDLSTYVTDVDGSVTWGFSGNTELGVSIVADVATITIPDVDWFGAESITFTATDTGLLADSDPALFTVTAVNDAPVVSDIPDQTIAEGATFTTVDLSTYVTDVDGSVTWGFSGNTELGVSIVADVATITIPDVDWFGAESITFTATDTGLLADSDPALFTVTAVNDAPVVSDIPDQTIAEGATFTTVDLSTYVTDVDGSVTWGFSGNTELGVSIVADVATITIPDVDWFGAESITFTATDTGLLADSDPALFTVTAVNDAPVVSDIPDQTIAEGATFTTVDLSTYVTDVDGSVTWGFSGNTELGVSIVADVATITIPDVDWFGAESITFTATDTGLLADSDPALFTVTAVNDAPVVSDIPDQTIAEGATFTTVDLSTYVTDVDGSVTWGFSGNTELGVSIVADVATITIPDVDWFGAESITFTATDTGLLADSDPALFTVTAVNDAPVVSDIPDQTIAEGATFTTVDLSTYVTDVDGSVTWGFSGNTELGVSIVADVATITIPDVDWFGAESITFTATDTGLLADSDPALFTVTAVNDAPVVSDIPDQTIAEGATFTTVDLSTYVTDVDGSVTWGFSGNTELGVSIVSDVATITIPDVDWFGAESITFTATDTGLLADSDPALFTVTAVNDAPVVSDIPDQTIAEGATFTTVDLSTYVTDVDGSVTWGFSGNTELGVSIVADVATITIPNVDWFGAETITFTATDTGLLADSDPATFTVTSENDAPVVTDIPDQTIAEGASFTTINLDDFVSDVDGSDADIVWTWAGETDLNVSIDLARVATITAPNADWFGAETITFTATDTSGLADSDPALFTVTAVNDAPIVSDIPDQTIAEGSTFTTVDLSTFVTDVDGSVTWGFSGNTELGVSIVADVATITIPDVDWFGAESITFTATDTGLLADSDPALFTVTAVNDAPVVSDIPDQTIAEGSTFTTVDLSTYVTDVDGSVTWGFSGNTELGVSIVADVATITIPDVDWFGAESITFTATDTGLLADSDPALFTVTAVNDAPVLAAIGAQSTDENVNLNFVISATDTEGGLIGLTHTTLPTGASFVDHGDGTGTFDWTPTYVQSGSYDVTFTATDDALDTDFEIVTITVNDAGNQNPVLAAIGAQATTESVNLAFGVSATDVDGSAITLTTSALPTGANFVDNGDGTGSFDWTPTYLQSGSYDITFTATDDSTGTDFEIVTITVNDAGNQDPVLATIGAQGVTEGNLLSFSVSATDPEGAFPALTTTALPSGAAFVDNGDGTGDFDWTPTFAQSGVYQVTFTATDDSTATDFEIVTITVGDAGNQAPVLATIGGRSVTEGALLSFGISATDPDGTTPTLSTSTLPTNAGFVDNGNGTGNFTFSPDFTQAGTHDITFYATDGVETDSELVTITVNDAGNQDPVLAFIGPQTVTEGGNLSFTATATDADGTVPTLTTSTLPTNATFLDNGDGTGDFDFNPDFLQSGILSVTFFASDGVASDSEVVFITINDAGNQDPILDPIGPQAVTEGSNLSFGVSASDPEGAIPSLTASNLPTNASFLDNGDGTGSFSFDPDFTQAGSYDVTFTATDDSTATDFEIVTITVNEAGNQNPVLAAIGPQATDENVNLAFTVTASDPDATIPVLSTSTLPANATFVDNLNGTGDFSFTPDFFQAGSFDITFYAADGVATDSELVTITVNNVNRDPVLAAIGPQAVDENATLAFTVTASDVDLTFPALTATGLPANATLNDNGDGTADFSFSPTFYQAGSYDVTFTADDSEATDFEVVTITVNNINQAPILDPIGPQFVTEGANLNLLITASDADSTAITITALPLPANATFVDNGDGTATFDFNPNYLQSDIISLTFTVSDGVDTDDELVFITINEAGNQPPVLDPIGPQAVIEGLTLNLTVTASDPEGAFPGLTTSALPPNASFVDNGDGTGDFSFSPDFTQSGSYDITFTATDDSSATDFEIVTVTVTESGNQGPVVSDIPDQTIAEGATFATINLDDYVADPDNLDTEINWTFAGNTELGVSIDVDRIATISIPDTDWYGAETITFTATDPGLLNDSDPAIFTVTAVNDAPVVADIPDQTVAEGATFVTVNLDSFVSDIDGAIADIVWTTSGETDLSVSIDLARVATITIPDVDWFGAETITFTATDTGLLADSDPATFTVTAVNDAPVVSDIPDQTIAEGSTFTTVDLSTYVTDIDGSVTWSFAGNTELGVSIVSDIATISIPDADWFGAETITFTATDTGLLADSDPALFTVTAVNDAPVVSDIPDQTVAEGATFTTVDLSTYVTDIDGSVTWGFSGNTELGVSIVADIATITIPDVDWFGAETITFTATDTGLLADSDPATFTVTAVNDAPIVTDIPDQTIAEGATFATINLDSFVSDIDGVPADIVWTTSGEVELTVSIDPSRVATVVIPNVDWFGTETITFTATDSGLLADSDPATFTVSAGADAPVVSDIPDQTIAEGATFATINLDDFVSDVDGADADINWTFAGNSELGVSIDGARVATITIPDVDWFGAETITFTATDTTLLFASDPATFTVTPVNDAPVVADIPDQTIAEGSTFTTIDLSTFVTDIDGSVTWSFSGNTELGVSIVSDIATISIPDVDWFGAESITFTATDTGLLADSDPALFTVTAVNDAPVVADIPDQTVAEGSTFTTVDLSTYVTDIDGSVTWSFSGNTVLGVSIVSDIATISIPDVDWFGAESITFTATDTGLLADSDPALFTVTAVNDAPVVSDIPDQTIAEGATFTTIDLSAFVTDIDGAVTWSFSGNSELGVNIVSDIATISIPDADWFGAESITFTATDTGLLADSDPATFTVTPVNDAPVVSDIPDQTIVEGATFATINLDSYVSDVDGVPADIAWTTSGETELMVVIDGARIATIVIPDVDWNGAETITFIATDSGLLTGSDPAVFTVTASSDAPIVSDIPDQTIAEGALFATINLDDFVSDIDGADADMVWTWSGNTELGVAVDGSRIATISIPDADWFGAETVTFTATDTSGLFASDPASFTVTPVNDAPVVADIPDQTIAEGSLFATIDLSTFVTDIDGAVTWTFSGNTELGVSIVSDIATISIPDADWFGAESITFTATDTGLLADSDPALFTVTAVQDAPVLAAIGPQSVAENANLNFGVSASDVDGTIPTLAADPLPGGASFLDNGDGTGTFDWTPGFDQAGLYQVWFVADDGIESDSELVDIAVGGTNRAPVADAGPDQFDLPAGFQVQLDGTGSSDPDLDGLTYAWVQVGGSTVLLSDDTSPTPTFTPSSLDTYIFELTVYDGVDFSQPDTVQILVVNGAPPSEITDLSIQVAGDAIQLSWSPILFDITALPTTIDRYVIYRGTQAFFTPTPLDSIGSTDDLTTLFTDNNILGADVVGDTLTQYFYVMVAVDLWENRSALSNRVGEFDYQLVTTPTSDYNLVGVPFANSGINTADDLISAIGTSNVLTVNNYVPASQSFQSRFAAGFGTNFAVVPGGIYQVNAAVNSVLTVTGEIPAPGSISYSITTTATTDFNFVMIPFDREGDFSVAQDVIDNIPGLLNTLNNFVAPSQNYESRFAIGFGTNFTVRAGKPYQANAAASGTFPAP